MGEELKCPMIMQESAEKNTFPKQLNCTRMEDFCDEWLDDLEQGQLSGAQRGLTMRIVAANQLFVPRQVRYRPTRQTSEIPISHAATKAQHQGNLHINLAAQLHPKILVMRESGDISIWLVPQGWKP